MTDTAGQGRAGRGARVVAVAADAVPGPVVIDIYARLSRSVNGETIEVEDQVELCTDEVHARGAVVGEVFRDNSFSAWNPKVRRPNWDRMMARIESGASNGVMVYDLFRFSRKVMEGERMVEAANTGARVWALAGEYKLTTADGRAAFREAMVKAAAESDKTSERVKLGKRRRARKGKTNGGIRAWASPGLAPRGAEWERGDQREMAAPELVAAERRIAKDVIERALAGVPMLRLCGELNARADAGEVGCAPTGGGRWTQTVLARTLRRPAMAGILTFHGEERGTLSGVDPVVDRETWERFCALLDARKTGRPAVDRYRLTGTAVCGRCGRPWRPHLRPGRAPYEDGTPQFEYRCRKTDATDTACGRNGIDGRTAEEAVRTAVIARLGNPHHAGRVAAHMAHVAQQRATVQAEIDRWEAEADALSAKTATWGVARVDRSMGPILAAIAKLEAERDRIEVPDSPAAATADAVAAWTEAEQSGNVAALRRLVKFAFPRLTLAPAEFRGDHRAEVRLLWDGPAEQRAA